MADPDAMKTVVVTGAGRFMSNRANLPALFTHRGAARGPRVLENVVAMDSDSRE